MGKNGGVGGSCDVRFLRHNRANECQKAADKSWHDLKTGFHTIPWGIKWGNAGQCRFQKNLLFQPRTQRTRLSDQHDQHRPVAAGSTTRRSPIRRSSCSLPRTFNLRNRTKKLSQVFRSRAPESCGFRDYAHYSPQVGDLHHRYMRRATRSQTSACLAGLSPPVCA